MHAYVYTHTAENLYKTLTAQPHINTKKKNLWVADILKSQPKNKTEI